jgi:hypothetical protein
MAECKGRTCELIMFQATNIVFTNLPAEPAAGSHDRCRRLSNSSGNKRALSEKLAEYVATHPQVVKGEECPDGCACVPAAQPSFGPGHPHTWSATFVLTRGDRTCKYTLHGTYDKAFAVVPGACTDGDDEHGEVSYGSELDYEGRESGGLA